ncbi:hypothetical protein DFH11DRAFT_1746866 [Phellopilus nigrolimitatus]|nr:hypothetical protein DFH11DRAFT_1746866 [Phellopilus nigrolimitatus]
MTLSRLRKYESKFHKHVKLKLTDTYSFPFGFTLQYYTIASITVLYYDHIITFPTELRRIWQRRLTLSSALFLINRYVTFCGYFVVLYLLFDPPDNILPKHKLCKNFARIDGYLSLFTQIIIAIMLSMRTYALYECNKWILISTTLLGLATVITSAVYPISLLLTLIFDGFIFTLTVVRTWKAIHEQRRCGLHSQLTWLVVRDEPAKLLIRIKCGKQFDIIAYDLCFSIIDYIYKGISATMLSRLLLNLHSFDDEQRGATSLSHPLPSMDFGISHYSTWTEHAADDLALDVSMTNNGNPSQ